MCCETTDPYFKRTCQAMIPELEIKGCEIHLLATQPIKDRIMAHIKAYYDSYACVLYFDHSDLH